MTDQSDSKTRECISAMMDDESSELELLRTTIALSEDAELRQVWHRYHQTSLVIKRQAPAAAPDLSEQIALAIAKEPELSVNLPSERSVDSPVDSLVGNSLVGNSLVGNSLVGNKASSQKVSSNGLFRKIAIAASVAVVTVIGVQQLQLGPDSVNDKISNATIVADSAIAPANISGPQFHLPSGFELPPVNLRTVSRSPQNQLDNDTHRQIQSYLQSMMVKYSRHGSLSYQVRPQDQDR